MPRNGFRLGVCPCKFEKVFSSTKLDVDTCAVSVLSLGRAESHPVQVVFFTFPPGPPLRFVCVNHKAAYNVKPKKHID